MINLLYHLVEVRGLEVKIHYSSKKLEKILSDERLINRHFTNCCQGLINRLAELAAVSNLSLISMSPPPRKHKLIGDLLNCWSVDVSKNYRLIFRAYEENCLDESEIKEIIIEEIKDYH